MRTHPKRLADAGISPARYRELQAICRQYQEMRRQVNLARAGIVEKPRRAHGWRHRVDPTGNAAVAMADHPAAKRVAIIEQCAQRVAEPAVAAAILRYVAEGVSYYRSMPPVGRNQFYILVLLFYVELDREMWG